MDLQTVGDHVIALAGQIGLHDRGQQRHVVAALLA